MIKETTIPGGNAVTGDIPQITCGPTLAALPAYLHNLPWLERHMSDLVSAPFLAFDGPPMNSLLKRGLTSGRHTKSYLKIKIN